MTWLKPSSKDPPRFPIVDEVTIKIRYADPANPPTLASTSRPSCRRSRLSASKGCRISVTSQDGFVSAS